MIWLAVIGFSFVLLTAYLLSRLFLQLANPFFKGWTRFAVAYGFAWAAGVLLIAGALSRDGALAWATGAIALFPVLLICLAADLLTDLANLRIPGFGTKSTTETTR